MDRFDLYRLRTDGQLTAKHKKIGASVFLYVVALQVNEMSDVYIRKPHTRRSVLDRLEAPVMIHWCQADTVFVYAVGQRSEL